MAVCIRYCNDSEIAKDALQETFINILKYINTYSGKGSFEGWIRRIAVNCSFGVLKKMKGLQFMDNIEHHHKIETTVPDIYSQLGAEELMLLIKQLPQVQYFVFNMKIIEGYSHNEIAEIMKITPSTSRSNLTRARANLIKLMQVENYAYTPKAILR